MVTTGQNRLALRLHETDVVHGFVAGGAGHVDLVVLREAVGEVGGLFMCSIIIDIWLIWAMNIVNLCGDNNLLGLVTGTYNRFIHGITYCMGTYQPGLFTMSMPKC